MDVAANWRSPHFSGARVCDPQPLRYSQPIRKKNCALFTLHVAAGHRPALRKRIRRWPLKSFGRRCCRAVADAPEVLVSPNKNIAIRNCQRTDRRFAEGVCCQHFEVRIRPEHERIA